MVLTNVNQAAKSQGFTLVELMIAIGIVAVLAAFALPAYNNYIVTAEQGQLVNNMETMQVFQEDFFLRNGNYAVNLADNDAIEDAIGWEPRTDDDIDYSIANGDGTSYSVTATSDTGMTICRVYPADTPC